MSALSALERVTLVKPWEIAIRRAGTTDILLIEALAHRIWKEAYTEILTQEQIGYMLQQMYSIPSLYTQMQEGHEFWVVEADEIPIGYASVQQIDADHVHLHKLYVDTQSQGHGVGGRMVEHIRKLYRPKKLTVDVNRNNTKAINFYFRHGFTIESSKDTDIGEGFMMEDFVMLRVGN